MDADEYERGTDYRHLRGGHGRPRAVAALVKANRDAEAHRRYHLWRAQHPAQAQMDDVLREILREAALAGPFTRELAQLQEEDRYAAFMASILVDVR